MMQRKLMPRVLLLIFSVSALTVACGRGEIDDEPTLSPEANTIIPTKTQTPIDPTSTPSPTPTPGEPTNTPRPTPTLPAIPEISCIPEDGVRTSGIVTGVVDGDTIDVTIRGLTFRVRYLGIDTPETRNPDTGIERGGKDASARNLELVRGQRVTLVSDPADNDMDAYGRLLRYVIAGDVFVNYQLVREGLARLFFSGIACGPVFFDAYEEAQADDVGLFAPTETPEN